MVAEVGCKGSGQETRDRRGTMPVTTASPIKASSAIINNSSNPNSRLNSKHIISNNLRINVCNNRTGSSHTVAPLERVRQIKIQLLVNLTSFPTISPHT